MSDFILVAPSDFSRSTVSASGYTYSVYGGVVTADGPALAELLSQGFSFQDAGLQTLLQLARRVKVVNLGADYTLSSASPGDLLKNTSASNYAVNLPKDPAIEEGAIISLLRLSTGTLIIVPSSGVVLTGEDAVNSNGLAQLLYLGANQWFSFGAVS